MICEGVSLGLDTIDKIYSCLSSVNLVNRNIVIMSINTRFLPRKPKIFVPKRDNCIDSIGNYIIYVF